MKRFILKGIVFLLPFPLWWGYELSLPMQAFAWRPAEAMTVFGGWGITAPLFPTGFFYPNSRVEMWQAGDRDPQGPRHKYVVWETDKWGYRNRPEIADIPNNEIVIVGDSNIWGAYLSQHELLAEVIMRKSEYTAFTFGGTVHGYGSYRDNPIFQDRIPRYLVWEFKRGELKRFSTVFNQLYAKGLKYGTSVEPRYFPALILLDRFLKNAMWRTLRSRLGVAGSVQVAGSPPPEVDPDKDFEANLEFFLEVNKRELERGSRLILVFLPDTVREHDELIREMEQQGICTVPFLPTRKWPHGVDLEMYWSKKDSHWTPEGVELTADRILKKMNSRRCR